MRILILGGTKFLGRHFVEAALARGHELTPFTRGQHDPGAFAGRASVAMLRGDRRAGPAGLASLADAIAAGARWDVVVDTSGFLPQDVAASAALLRDRASLYVFVSSISAYASFATIGMTEDEPLAPYTDAARTAAESLPLGATLSGQALGEHYGALKAECERVAQATFGAERTLIVRPGLIVGPYDPTDRFTYWPMRAMRGGDILGPGRPERPIQFIDARDLAEWMVRMCERGSGGVFHATSPVDRTLTMGEMLETCLAVAADRGAPPGRLVWASDEFLLEQKIGPWMELPLWIPENDPAMDGFQRSDLSRARALGLRSRPSASTISSTIDWDATRAASAPRAAGLAREREAEVIAELVTRAERTSGT